ncbi:prepilin peptidase [Patescibacteria group bacterium]|nr:prepilin peptidase [Patescibacteria group bacterium]MBU4056465.1 prepilin peptidase [Patescibacteria group bacterium]
MFFLGLIAGSFLNVVICRLETGETMVSGRSHCPRCGHILAWYDLVPVFSFLMLKGKCRYCGKPISIQYPMVEMATGILFLSIFNYQFSIFNEFSISNFQFLNSAFNFFYFLLSTFYFLFIISSLIIIFVYDLRHYIIPDKIVYPAIIVSVIYSLFENLNFGHWDLFGNWKLEIGNLITLFNPFIAAILTGAFFLSIVLITKGAGMGGGDVKIAFLMGLILGWPKVLAALFLAFTAGAIYGIILILMRKKTLKSKVPFGPFLVAGTLVALFWGGEIMRWYFGYLF